MGHLDINEITSIGVNDDTWKSLRSDEARSLLCMFAAQDADSRALGAVLVSTPNGKDLYVTPRMMAYPAY
jgi:hypothetical protein